MSSAQFAQVVSQQHNRLQRTALPIDSPPLPLLHLNPPPKPAGDDAHSPRRVPPSSRLSRSATVLQPYILFFSISASAFAPYPAYNLQLATPTPLSLATLPEPLEMGFKPREYLTSEHKVFGCRVCRTHLSTAECIESKVRFSSCLSSDLGRELTWMGMSRASTDSMGGRSCLRVCEYKLFVALLTFVLETEMRRRVRLSNASSPSGRGQLEQLGRARGSCSGATDRA